MSKLGVSNSHPEFGYEHRPDSICLKLKLTPKCQLPVETDELAEAVALTNHGIAECLVPSHSANQFTVIGKGTSVTHRGLADSVLISVGKLALGQSSQRAPTGVMWPNGRNCSFRGGACIQYSKLSFFGSRT
jgi:hypothetical protein